MGFVLLGSYLTTFRCESRLGILATEPNPNLDPGPADPNINPDAKLKLILTFYAFTTWQCGTVRPSVQLNKPPRKVAHKRKEAQKSLIISAIL